jgi:hypothetical protein
MYVLTRVLNTDWLNESRSTSYSKGTRPLSMENSVIFQLNKHKACICAHTMAAVPLRRNHTHSSNGVLFMANTEGVWISCLKQECTMSLNNNWYTYKTHARYVNRLWGGELLYAMKFACISPIMIAKLCPL